MAVITTYSYATNETSCSWEMFPTMLPSYTTSTAKYFCECGHKWFSRDKNIRGDEALSIEYVWGELSPRWNYNWRTLKKWMEMLVLLIIHLCLLWFCTFFKIILMVIVTHRNCVCMNYSSNCTLIVTMGWKIALQMMKLQIPRYF